MNHSSNKWGICHPFLDKEQSITQGSAAACCEGLGDGGALLADVGRLFGRLYAGGVADGGGGDDLGDPPREPVREPGPEPGALLGGGGLLTRSVPAFTCSLNDCCWACLSAPSDPPPDPAEAGRPIDWSGVPGDPKAPMPPMPLVGGVTPSGPVPENCEVGVWGPRSYPLSKDSTPAWPPTLKACAKSLLPGLLLGGGGGGATGRFDMPVGPKGGKLPAAKADGMPGKSIFGLDWPLDFGF